MTDTRTITDDELWGSTEDIRPAEVTLADLMAELQRISARLDELLPDDDRVAFGE